MEVKGDMKVEEVKLRHQYFWVESVRPEKLHEIQVKLNQSGKVFDAINPQGKVAHRLPDSGYPQHPMTAK
jgi:hypothetical protein